MFVCESGDKAKLDGNDSIKKAILFFSFAPAFICFCVVVKCEKVYGQIFRSWKRWSMWGIWIVENMKKKLYLLHSILTKIFKLKITLRINMVYINVHTWLKINFVHDIRRKCELYIIFKVSKSSSFHCIVNSYTHTIISPFLFFKAVPTALSFL